MKRFLLLVVTGVTAATMTAGEASALIRRTGVYTSCNKVAEGTPLADHSLAECNAVTGAVAAYATAWVGAAAGQALQYWNIPITPQGVDTPVDVYIDMIVAHGTAGTGAGSFNGTQLVYAVGAEENYTREDLDAWIDAEIALSKIVAILAPIVPGPISTAVDIMEYTQTAMDAIAVEDIWQNGVSSGRAHEDQINFSYWVSPFQSSIKIWAGVRAAASGAVTGTGVSIAAGRIQELRIEGIDPPVPVVVAGPDSVLPGHIVPFRLSVPGNYEDVRYWVDWDDGQAPEQTGWFRGGDVVELWHTFNNVNSQYLISVKAIERDNLESGYTDHNLLCWDGKPNRVNGVEATDGEHCDKVAITWDPEGLAVYYTVWIESPGMQVSGDLYDTYYFADTAASPGDDRRYYVVAHNSHGESDSYDFDYGHRKDVPEPAFALSAAADPCLVQLDWRGYPGGSGTNTIDYYKIYRSDSDVFGTAEVTDSIPGTCGDCTYDDLPDSSDNYYYWIVASNECGDAAPSDYASVNWSGISPPSPSPIAASDDECGYVEVSWIDISGFSYKVLRDGVYAHTHYVSSPFEDTGAEIGVWHEYEVEAWNTSCSTVVRAGPVLGIRYPYATWPVTMTATEAVYCDKVRLEWTPVPYATQIEIFSDNEPDLGWNDLIATVSGDATSYDDYGAPWDGEVMYYRVVSFTACDPAGTSMSPAVSGNRAQTTIATPSGLAVTDSTTCNTVSVSWDPLADANSYSLYRDASEIMQLTGTSYFDQSATPGVPHSYQITAHTPCFESPLSSSDSGTVVSLPPPPPSNLSATDKTLCDRIEVTWNGVVGAGGYKVIRDGATLVDSLVGTSYLDTLVSASTTYTYEVRSLSLCGEGAGVTDNGRPGKAPVAPAWLLASRGTRADGVELRWGTGTSTAGYTVIRDGSDIGTTIERNFIDRYAVPGVTYLYTARSLTECGESGPSPADSGYIDPAAVMPRIVADDVDLFQDTFPFDGAPTGIGRADMARDILPATSAGILPGDSVCVTVLDTTGLDEDPFYGGAAVYCWVRVNSPDPGAGALGRIGEALVDNPSRWPVADSAWVGGHTWYQVRMDTVFTGPGRNGPVPDEYCVDLNDNLFESGDTVLFFFHTRTALAEEMYWSEFGGLKANMEETVASPMEFQVLPGGGYLNGGTVLYVNDAGDHEAVLTFQNTFRLLGHEEFVDRFDVRGPAACASNSPGGSGAVGGFWQLTPFYDLILWDTGRQRKGTLGDGTGSPEKANDFQLLHDFLEERPDYAAVYICGDEVAGEWKYLNSASAVAFKGLINHNVTTRFHWNTWHEISPLVYGLPPAPFYHAPSRDSFYVQFEFNPDEGLDVLEPTGAATMIMRYDQGPSSTSGAVIMEYGATPFGGGRSVMLSGFGFNRIRDLEATGVPTRAHHLRDILGWFGEPVGDPVDVEPVVPAYVDRLAQNRPNPFNPATTIEFSLRAPARVTLSVYNVRGQLVRVLVDEPRAAGLHKDVSWEGRNDSGQSVASGIYFYRLTTGNFTDTKKMVLLK
jgi:hypothetical protein